MMTSHRREDSGQTETPEGGAAGGGRERRPGEDPRATSHPTGEKQAAENAENEPAG